MGFGYLLVGYTVAYLISLTVAGLGFGALGEAVGFLLMLAGLRPLRNYHRPFRYAAYPLYLLTVCALFDCICLALQDVWTAPDALTASLPLVRLLLQLLFHFLLYFAVYGISKDVALPKLCSAAVFNGTVYLLWTVVFALGNLLPEGTAVSVLSFVYTLLNFAWILLDVILLLRCDKNIAPAQEVKHRSRFAFVNKLNDALNEREEKAIEKTKQEAVEYVRKRKEARENKEKRKKK